MLRTDSLLKISPLPPLSTCRYNAIAFALATKKLPLTCAVALMPFLVFIATADSSPGVASPTIPATLILFPPVLHNDVNGLKSL